MNPIGAEPKVDGKARQIVDPAVSRAKFDIEVAEFRSRDTEHRRRGWWLLEAEFPRVSVVFTAAQLRPAPVICGVELDFTNYDLEPPSVHLVDPFTRQAYRQKELPTSLLRRQVIPMPPGFPAGAGEMVGAVPLMQAHLPDDIPFLCVPGVREYHEHPAHSGDSWLIHRGQGAGKLYSVLHTIYQYGIQPISGYEIGMRVVGFQQGEPPQ